MKLWEYFIIGIGTGTVVISIVLFWYDCSYLVLKKERDNLRMWEDKSKEVKVKLESTENFKW